VDTATVTEIADVSGNCASHKFTFTGSITVSAPGTVTYYWKRSDASSPTTQSITFTSAGTQTVSTDWTYGATTATSPRNASMAIYIDTPNHQLFPATSVSLICH
jgi:hypothetical protein